MIPISKYKDYNYSLDVMENIVSLCSHCHNLLHYGPIILDTQRLNWYLLDKAVYLKKNFAQDV